MIAAEESHTSRESAAAVDSWPAGVDAAEAEVVSTVASCALACATAFTARPLHFRLCFVGGVKEIGVERTL